MNMPHEDIAINTTISPLQVVINEMHKSRKQQLYPIISDQEFLDMESLWMDLNDVKSVKGLNQWVASLREYVWGSHKTFEESSDVWNLHEESYYSSRVSYLLGTPLFDLIESSDFPNILAHEQQNIDDVLYVESVLMKKRFEKSIVETIPQDLTFESLSEDAKKLSERYNLKNISFNYSLSFEEIWFYLNQLENSLKMLNQKLHIPEKTLGLNCLSISFELGNESSYDYFPNEKRINIGIDYYGKFGEAWCIFIDNIMGEKYNIFNEDYCFLSELSFSTTCDETDDLFELRQSIRRKFSLNNSHSSALLVMRNAIDYLPIILNKLMKDTSSRLIRGFLEERVFELKNVISDLLYRENTEENYQAWSKWRDDSELLWKEIQDSKSKKKIYRQWIYLIALIEKITFGKEIPKHKLWYIFAVFKDKTSEKNTRYWSAYHMLMARSFSCYVYEHVKKETGLASNTQNVMLYPLNKERAAEIAWWEKWFPTILSKLNE